MTSYNLLEAFVFLNTTNRLFWNVSRNSGFIWRTFQCFFIIFHIIGSFLLSLLDKEFYLYYFFFFFFLNKSFRSVLSNSSLLSFKMFSSYPLSMDFCFSIAVFFIFSQWGTDSQHLAIRYAVFKWLWMVWMCMDIGLLISGFSVEGCLKSCSWLYISMSPKMIYCCVKYCVQIWSFYVCFLNFLKIQVVHA